MGDRNADFIFDKLQALRQTDTETEMERKRRNEQREAEAQAYHAEAYRQMPADLRQQSETWGVKALMEAVWMNGWDCGYRQSVRDRVDATPAPQPAPDAKEQI